MNRFKLFQYHSVCGWLLFVFHALTSTLPGSALAPGSPRIKAGPRAAVRTVRDVPFTPQTQCFVSCLDAACPGPGSTTTSTTVTTTTGTTTTDTATWTATTWGPLPGPNCTVSVSPYQPLYSPTACSEIILYGSVTTCTTVAYRSGMVSFVLEGLASCFEVKNDNSYSIHDLFPTTILFTPVRYNNIVCDVGQGLRYSGNITAIDNNYNPPVRLTTWSITVDTSNLEHCIGTNTWPLDTRCYVTLDAIISGNSPFRPTSCGRTDLARTALQPGCSYFSNFAARFELSGFESCSAMQFINGVLLFDMANGKSCNVTSAQQHNGVLKAFNSYNVESYDTGAWGTWEITLLTGGMQSCPAIWNGSVTTTTTAATTTTTTGWTTTTDTTTTTT